ncbi:hypothetical protein J4405_04440 [Candidatus Woesearchaeota archaeon]|nr:hypothetical protein [Candidatus Woesearchaeota archaeon]
MTNGNNGNKLTSKKFLFVSFESVSGDLAWQLKKEGHEVKAYIESESDKDVYDGILEKVKDWKEHVDWADVVVFDYVGFGSTADSLRAKGKLVIGGSVYTDKLEQDREFGQNEMKRVGMLTLPHWDFSDFNSAIEFIKKNPGRYVFKPFDSNQKGILFMSQEDDGNDLIEILEQNKIAWAKKIKRFQLQKMAVGVEVAVGVFFNGKDFIYPIHVNFEHKKLFPGDLGPYCYSSDTEVLTDKGWKTFGNVNYEDKILSFNKDSKLLQWEYPLDIYWKKYTGKMVEFKNREIDLLVTPNHRMLNILRKNFYKSNYKFKTTLAKELLKSGEFTVLQAGNFQGENPIYFELPECKDGRKYINPKKQIDIISWSRFMGWYLSEGSCFKNGIRIAQYNTSKHLNDIKKVLEALPFNFSLMKNEFKIHSTQLSIYLKQFGLCQAKYVPDYIKNGNYNVIKAFLDEFVKGDGSIHDGQKRYHSTSYRLISDIQEMLIKINVSSSITIDKRESRLFPNGKKYNINKVYSLEERKKPYVSIRKNNKKEIDYDDYVGCVQVPSSYIVVRKNGRPAISGNTGEMGTLGYWSPPNEIFRATLQKIKPELIKSGYVGYFDINCIANAKGIYPLEFTCRFGYPTISLQMEGILTEMGDFLYKLASHESFELKTKKGFQICICIVVPPFPFEDKNETFIYKDLSILFKKQNLDGVHLGDVKIIDNVWTVAGETGYVLVITGSGLTVDDARKQAHHRVKNIILQNMYYRVDIGVRWHQDSDKLQTWGYLY